jgi:hypothetical protein
MRKALEAAASIAPSSTVVFERRPGLVLRALLAAGVSTLFLVGEPFDLEWWHQVLGGGPGWPQAFTALTALSMLALEGHRFLRLTPRSIAIDGRRLLLRFSKDREEAIELEKIREVRKKPKLSLVMASGEVHRFDWHSKASDEVVTALETALLLQPVPGLSSALRPLLHPGEPIERIPTVEIPLGGRMCPSCSQRFPSNHWFVLVGPSSEGICRTCAARPTPAPPSLEGATEAESPP